jgi:hypothetical protein
MLPRNNEDVDLQGSWTHARHHPASASDRKAKVRELAVGLFGLGYDRVLSDAVREHDPRELLNYMDQFVAQIS